MFTMGFLFVFVVGALLSQANCHPDVLILLASLYTFTTYVGCLQETTEPKLSRGCVLANIGNRQSFVENFATSGHQIPINSAPYVASIYKDLSDGLYAFSCGASIIHEQFVLTAADCCPRPKRQNKFKILVGTDKYDEGDGTDGQFLEIDQIIVHEKYDFNDFNVCLIKLKETLTFGPKVGKIDLAKRGSNLYGGTALNATGWKNVWNPDNGQILYQVEIPLVAKKTCKEQWSTRYMDITQRMICAGGAGYEYPGSTGNPLTLGDVQVGLSTRQSGIRAGLPAIYTRVASMAEWIYRKIQKFQ